MVAIFLPKKYGDSTIIGNSDHKRDDEGDLNNYPPSSEHQPRKHEEVPGEEHTFQKSIFGIFSNTKIVYDANNKVGPG